MENIKRHLARLADFSGRENREPFWWWVLAIYIVQTVLGTLLSSVLQLRMSAAMRPMEQDPTYFDRHPEQVFKVMSEVLLPYLQYFAVFAVLGTLVHITLLAAAVARRLHDRDRSGWWAVPYAAVQLAIVTIYALMLPRFFGTILSLGSTSTPDQAIATLRPLLPAVALIALFGVLSFALMIVLIVMLAKRGTVGPNRYGEDLLPPPLPLHAPPGWQPSAAPPAALARVVRGPGADIPPGN